HRLVPCRVSFISVADYEGKIILRILLGEIWRANFTHPYADEQGASTFLFMMHLKLQKQLIIMS
ncbi:MAG: hypothetical protein ACO1OT_09495, partial [Heyndrickxia sp.]